MKLRLLLITFLVLLAFIFSLSLFLYHKDSTYELILNIENSLQNTQKGRAFSYGLRLMDNFVNEISPSRAFYKIKFEEPESVNLILSGPDVNEMTSQMDLFLEKGFIKDELNVWRKAKLRSGRQDLKIKYKFHGTSVTPLSVGKFSLRIKLNKEGPYPSEIREFNLIRLSKNSDEKISTISINNIANYFGLLSSNGNTAILKINGVKMGLFYKVERMDKEWFEKNQITNFRSTPILCF